MTSRNLSRHNKFENSVSEAILSNSTTLYCDLCQTYSGDHSLQHFVTTPMFFTIELSPNCINCVVFTSTMEVLGCWPGGEGYLNKCNTRRLRPEVQPLTLLYIILAEKVPLLYTFY